MLSSLRHRQLNLLASIKGWRSLGVLYGAQVVAALAGFLYSKGVAVYIDPGQFGTYSIQLATMTLVYSALVSPIVQSFKSALQQRSSLTVIPFYTGLLGRLYALTGLVVAGLMGAGVLPAVSLLIWLGGLLQGLLALSNDYLNLSFRHNRYALMQSLTPLLNLVLLIILAVSGTSAQATGLWINYCCLYGISASLATYYAYRAKSEFRLTISWKAVPEWLVEFQHYKVYAIPLMVYALFGWFTNYADRYLIAYLMSPADVGYYTVGYSLGARVALLATPLIAHLTPTVFAIKQSGQPTLETHSVIKRYLFLFWGLAIPTCMLLAVFHNEIGQLLLADRYLPAFAVVPLIALAYVFLLSIQFLETKFYAYGYTKYILWHNIVGASINVLLNLWLIPHFGLIGAAMAMLGSCFAQLGVALYLFKKTNR